MKKLKNIINKFKVEDKVEACKNPYLNARRAWNTHNAGLMKSLHLWQLVGLSSLLISISAVFGLISIGSQSKFVPLVFQQDAKGNTLSITRGDKVNAATLTDFRTVAARFIENLRMVSVDQDLQTKAVYQVYAHLQQNDLALKKVQEFYQDKKSSNPFVRAEHEAISIDIKSVIQESKNTWQVDWVETTRSLDGQIKKENTSMKALITLYQKLDDKDMDNESVLKNPHLIFVQDFNWSKDFKTGGNE